MSVTEWIEFVRAFDITRTTLFSSVTEVAQLSYQTFLFKK